MRSCHPSILALHHPLHPTTITCRATPEFLDLFGPAAAHASQIDVPPLPLAPPLPGESRGGVAAAVAAAAAGQGVAGAAALQYEQQMYFKCLG